MKSLDISQLASSKRAAFKPAYAILLNTFCESLNWGICVYSSELHIFKFYTPRVLDYISKWVSNLHFNYSNRRLAVLYHKNIDKHGQHWLKGFLVEAANVGDQLSGAHQTLTLLLLHICVYMATKSLFCTKAKTLPWKSESQSFCGPDCRLSWFV